MNYAPHRRILIDIDGTVAWWEKQFIKQLNLHAPHLKPLPFGTRTVEDEPYVFEMSLLPEVRLITSLPGYYRTLEPIVGAQEVIQQLREDGHDVWFCTAPARNNIHSASEKIQWVEEHHGKDMSRRVIITNEKELVLGDFLIDDLWRGEKPHAVWDQILFNQSYNEHIEAPRRLNSWDYDELALLLNS